MGIYYLISILIFIVCILLILVVLVQNSKGGGLSSTFASSNQVLGVKKTADFLEKSTWTLAVTLFVLTLSTIFVIPRGNNSNAKMTTKEVLEANQNTTAPVNYDPSVSKEAADGKAPEATPQLPE
jgi:preprotein translocase subunit SecG